MNVLMLSTAVTFAVLAQEADLKPADPANDALPKVMLGRITGNNVNVRSGASTNFYPLVRLDKGTQVVIHEMKHGWARIAPPAGCYSLVAKEYVEPDGEDKGVINGNRVWIRPGSDLDEGPYYAKQLQLNKGQSIQILGETDKQYKIVPPQGALAWISADYVDIVDRQFDAAKAVADAAGVVQQAPPAPSDDTIADVSTKQSIQLIEADLAEEFKKDIAQRDLQTFVARFEKIAAQDADYAAQQYALYRIDQLNRTMQRTEALLKVRALAAQVEQQREAFLRQRADMRPQTTPIQQDFAVRGKLIKSFAYDSPANPRRYRLVDPDSPELKTIAYVEIDPASVIDPAGFLGRFVGVRAQNQRIITGSVDAVVVYTAAEIVILEQP